MHINQLRDQLADLKKKEAVAQTRESLLLEEREKILKDIEGYFNLVKELNIISEEELIPSNLPAIVNKLQSYIDEETRKSSIPAELL